MTHVTRARRSSFCERAEELGFASLWVQEHLFFALEPSAPYAARPGMPVPEAYRTTWSPLELLTAAAAWTERIALGTGILVGGYHRPVELAQRLATLDQLSNGRLIVGLSVGWSKDEHDQMDVEFTTRGRRMDELVEALHGLLGTRPGGASTASSSTSPTSIVSPKPVQQPHPPLLSGMRSAARPATHGGACSTCGTRHRARSNRSSQTAGRDRRHATAGRCADRGRPADLHRAAVRRAGPRPDDDRSDGRRRAPPHGDAGFAHVVVDTGFTTEVASPDDWADVSRPAGPAPSGSCERVRVELGSADSTSVKWIVRHPAALAPSRLAAKSSR